MKRLLSILALSVALSIPAADAAETSKLEVTGFTRDGSVFVFEEYGVTDGIGLPYASIFAIDVESDRWLPNSPARIKMREGEMMLEGGDEDYAEALRVALAETRNRVRAQADPFLLQIGDLEYGTARVRNTPWELGIATRYVRFTTRDLLPSDGKAHALALEQIDFPASEECFSMVEQMKGYRLTLIDEAQGERRVLHEDTRIPESRGCPLGYRIEAVHTHTNSDNRTALAVVLRYYKPGFEGPDGRLLALTTMLD